MYPIITIGSYSLNILGIAIVISLLTFLFNTYRLAKKSRIQFIKIFYRLPLPLVSMYILGGYMSFVSKNLSRLPSTTREILEIFSPYGYSFHIIGIAIAIVISIHIFLKKMPSRHERGVWINIIASSTTIALIPLGMGLLMGDSLIGLPTEGIFGMSSLQSGLSRRGDYGNIYPVGGLIAILGLITTTIQHIKQNMKHPIGVGYLTLAITSMGLGLIRILVNTPKHFVAQFLSTRLDATTYLMTFIAIFYLQNYITQKHKSKIAAAK